MAFPQSLILVNVYVLKFGTGRMRRNWKFAKRMRACVVLNAWALEREILSVIEDSYIHRRQGDRRSEVDRTHMMSVNALFGFATLEQGTRVQTSQEGNCVNLIWGRLVLVNKAAAVPFRAWPAEKVVIAEFAAVFSLLHGLQNNGVDVDWFVVATGSRFPFWLRSLRPLRRLFRARVDTCGSRRQRQCDLRWRAGRFYFLSHIRIR